MSPRIVPFVEDRRAEVVALWRACGLVVSTGDPDGDIDRKLSYQPELFLIALVEERLAGTVMAGYEGHRGWINYLAVDPELQNRGIARELMRAAEVKLRDLGCPKINLMVRGTNTEVVEFYERIGYGREDRVVMSRRLE